MDYYEGQCIICGNKTERKRYDFCLDCYHSMQEIETGIIFENEREQSIIDKNKILNDDQIVYICNGIILIRTYKKGSL